MDGRLVFLPAVVGRILVRWKCKKVSASPFPPPCIVSRSDAHRRSVRRAPAGGASHVPAGLFVIPSPLGRKKGCGAKKSVSCARCCRPGSSIPQLRSLPPSSKLFSKKGVKKFAGKEKGYTFAAANEVKRSNPSGLEKRLKSLHIKQQA